MRAAWPLNDRRQVSSQPNRGSPTCHQIADNPPESGISLLKTCPLEDDVPEFLDDLKSCPIFGHKSKTLIFGQ
jgi:hypothetical protein